MCFLIYTKLGNKTVILILLLVYLHGKVSGISPHLFTIRSNILGGSSPVMAWTLPPSPSFFPHHLILNNSEMCFGGRQPLQRIDYWKDKHSDETANTSWETLRFGEGAELVWGPFCTVSVLSLKNVLDIISRSLLYIQILTLSGDGGDYNGCKIGSPAAFKWKEGS